jgi:hypothetical protein
MIGGTLITIHLVCESLLCANGVGSPATAKIKVPINEIFIENPDDGFGYFLGVPEKYYDENGFHLSLDPIMGYRDSHTYCTDCWKRMCKEAFRER